MEDKKPSYQELEKECSLLKKEIEFLKSAENPDKIGSARISFMDEYQHMVLDLKENERKLIESNEELKVINESLEKAREEIEKNEERLNLIVKNSNDIFVLVNEKGEQYFISDAATKLSGYTAEELSGPIENVIFPDDVNIVKDHWDRLMKYKDKADRIEYRHIHKEKGYIWLEAIAQNFLDHPAIHSVVANIRDITKRKKTEEALKRISAANERLQEKERDRMLNELADNQKKLASTILKSIQNAERDADIIKQLKELKKYTDSKGQQIIHSLILNRKNTSLNANWEEFETLFEKVHHSFYEKLNEKFPRLTANELKICAFLKLNMSTRDISQITFQSHEALKKARYRLRQKLGIDRNVNIAIFLNSL